MDEVGHIVKDVQ